LHKGVVCVSVTLDTGNNYVALKSNRKSYIVTLWLLRMFPVHSSVTLVVDNMVQERNITNIVGVMRGHAEPGRYQMIMIILVGTE